MGLRYRRHRAADLAGAERGHPRADRRRRAVLLRRHRAHRPAREHRYGRGLDAIALRQGRPGRHGAPTTSTARWPRSNTRPSSTRCSRREKTEFKDWEKATPYFEGCLPIEVMAERGRETLRFGPMKPVGLDDPRTGRWPYAVVQLRQDNALGTLWNMVGFQTKLKHGEQTRIFRTIPGLEHAVFARLGGLHRNTFLNSPKLLDTQLRLKADPRLRFAGQITGVEGYVESAAIGLARGALRRRGVDGPRDDAASANHRARRARGAHHRRAPRGRKRGQPAQLPADERQFRPVPADRRSRRRKASASKAQPAASRAKKRSRRARWRI